MKKTLLLSILLLAPSGVAQAGCGCTSKDVTVEEFRACCPSCGCSSCSCSLCGCKNMEIDKKGCCSSCGTCSSCSCSTCGCKFNPLEVLKGCGCTSKDITENFIARSIINRGSCCKPTCPTCGCCKDIKIDERGNCSCPCGCKFVPAEIIDRGSCCSKPSCCPSCGCKDLKVDEERGCCNCPSCGCSCKVVEVIDRGCGCTSKDMTADWVCERCGCGKPKPKGFILDIEACDCSNRSICYRNQCGCGCLSK